MSFRALELQIAIPKTFDAGKLADNHQQNIHSQQFHANEALKKEIERKQLSVNESDELDQIGEDGNDSQQNGQSNLSDKKKQTEEKPAKHPFKGNLFDYSG